MLLGLLLYLWIGVVLTFGGTEHPTPRTWRGLVVSSLTVLTWPLWFLTLFRG